MGNENLNNEAELLSKNRAKSESLKKYFWCDLLAATVFLSLAIYAFMDKRKSSNIVESGYLLSACFMCVTFALKNFEFYKTVDEHNAWIKRILRVSSESQKNSEVQAGSSNVEYTSKTQSFR